VWEIVWEWLQDLKRLECKVKGIECKDYYSAVRRVQGLLCSKE
jgi:hypothetical protein